MTLPLTLTHDTLREALLDIFFTLGNKERLREYVLPIQGNWWNPIDRDSAMMDTWIGYSIIDRYPILRSRYDRTTDAHIVTTRATVHLQFIGRQAESFAASILHWDERQDVKSVLARFDGQLMYDSRRVRTSMYYQDGANSTLAYNVDFRFLYSDVVTPSVHEIVTGAEVSGTLYIPEIGGNNG